MAEEQCRALNQQYTPQQVQLWQDLSYLSDPDMQGRKGGTEGARLARDYIVKRFAQSGLQPLAQLASQQDNQEADFAWHHYFSPTSMSSVKKGVNVVGYLPGETQNQFIVITAHYDHLGKKGRHVFSGANDNASGVAALFYLAHKLGKRDTALSIIFLATDYEEAGLKGAAAFLEDNLIAPENIKLNINLDMIAQPGRYWTLYASGTHQQPQFKPVIEQVITSSPVCFEMGLDKPSRSYDRKTRIDWRKASDHWEFARRDIPWLYLGVKDYKYYHTPRDTIDKLSRPFYIGVVDTALNTVIAMDHFLSR
ncbi:M28 family peptidase [Planctobacterium marinum]|uniref:Aminopeptidase n=1 Tax=Planctobacterium marinum TaxID=1631968 RepID=A0AA48HNJ6_9ALTE|nr:aminopeptidase [Planctobacterium marinum]